MVRPIIILLFFITGVVYGQQQLSVSREEAIRIALHEIIIPATLDHKVTAFLVKTALQPGDEIKPFLNGKTTVISEPTWFVWINDNPKAFFAHTTRYVFINAMNRNIRIKKFDWWPELNGQSLFMSDEERRDLDLIIYSDVHLVDIDDR